MRSVVLGFALMVLSGFFFAVSGPVAKALYTIDWTPGSVVLVRLSGAALLLLVPTLWGLRGRWGEVREHWRTVLVFGVVSMAGVQAFFFLAVEELSVAVAILLEMMGAPLIVVLWLWARTGHRPATVTFVGLLVSLVGVVLVLDLHGSSVNWVGVVMALAAAGCIAYYFLLSATLTIDVPPIAFAGLGMLVGAAAAGLLVVVQVLPARFVSADLDFAGRTVAWWLPAALLAAFTVGAYVCGIMSLRYIGATVGGVVNLVEIPFAALAAWVVLGEALSAVQLVGGGILLAGIGFIKWGDVRLERRLAALQPEPLPEEEPGADSLAISPAGPLAGQTPV